MLHGNRRGQELDKYSAKNLFFIVAWCSDNKHSDKMYMYSVCIAMYSDKIQLQLCIYGNTEGNQHRLGKLLWWRMVLFRCT